MKWIFPLLAAAALTGQEAPKPSAPPPPAVSAAVADKSVLTIDPKTRANDYVQAFDLLRKDKPTLKIMIRTAGATFQNVAEISAAPGGTLLYIRVLSNQGMKIQVVPIEEMMEISYSL